MELLHCITELPCPRLEFVWEVISDYTKHCHYNLVLPLKQYDIRREDEDGNDVRTEKVVEINCTVRNGNSPLIYGEGDDRKVDTPFRDYAHAQWDNVSLGGHLPIVAVYGDQFCYVEYNKND